MFLFDLQQFGSSNNASQQNQAANQQINQNTTGALQRLQQFNAANPFPLTGVQTPAAATQLGGIFGGNTGGQVAGGTMMQQLMQALQGAQGGGQPQAPPQQHAGPQAYSGAPAQAPAAGVESAMQMRMPAQQVHPPTATPQPGMPGLYGLLK